MLPAPIPDDDDDRLAALHALLILDTPPEERFDRLVAFAAEQFEVPIALVSLVDERRQWFKARVGLNVCETSREISFCGHAIVRDELFVVEDALADARFADNPLVTGEPHVRFYAGTPLTVNGRRVGTFCLIDTAPRRLDRLDEALLRSLGRLATEALDGVDGEPPETAP